MRLPKEEIEAEDNNHINDVIANPSIPFLLEIADILESIDDYDRIEIILKSVEEELNPKNKMEEEVTDQPNSRFLLENSV